MAGQRKGERCPRCGHPMNKHTLSGGGGCCVKIYTNVRRITALCPCRNTRERVK